MSKNKQILIICIFLTTATLIAFWQVNHGDFNIYDDIAYVTGNSYIRNGITIEGIGWAFTTSHAANWHPLTWLSHMLDVEFFGLQPRWHHLTNLLFHITNTLLLFLVFYRMTKELWHSAFVAALFALHPLHVESVAWIAERKDVLSAFFWILTIGAYVYYVECPVLRRYLTVLILFGLGLMTKPMLVTLPFVLLLLDYWPLKRFDQKKSAQENQAESGTPVSWDKLKGNPEEKHTEVMKAGEAANSEYKLAFIHTLLWEKIPFFALTALSSTITYVAQQKWGAVSSFEAMSLSVRIENAFVSYIIYIGKMVWPNNLAVIYPHPGLWPLWQVIGAAFLLITVSLLVILAARKFPYLTIGWLWYLGTLVPVIGIVQVGSQARADRYTYIPLIGLFIMAVWGIPELLKKWRYLKEALFAASALTISFFFIVTWIQVGYWQNSIILFEHTLKVTDNNAIAHNARGTAYGIYGNYNLAIGDFNRAIEINPKYAGGYCSRGKAYAALGNYRHAIEDYDRAIEINPKYSETYYNRGIAYSRLGNNKQAIDDFDRAIEINPKYAEAYCNRGAACGIYGNYNVAIGDLDRAIEIDPKYAEAYCNRGAVYGRLGNHNLAIRDFDKAIEINPKYAEAYNNRGIAYYSLGMSRQALEDRKTAAGLGNKIAQNFFWKQSINWQ
jgi:tetratricopeptide (TPR) repeat protein